MSTNNVVDKRATANNQTIRGTSFLIIILGFIHSITYLVIIPPWQHYDEPSHMVRIIAYARNLDPDKLPDTQSIRREIASSMLKHNFWAGTSQSINLLVENSPVWIGVSQTNDPQLYYLLLGTLLKPIGYVDILILLYLARIASVILYIATISISYKTISLLFPSKPLIPIFSSLLLAGLPSYVDIMTSVNNDVLAIFSFSLFLLFCTQTILKGKSVTSILGLVLTALLCILTKSTVYAAIFLAPLALFVTIQNPKIKRGIAIGAFLSLLAVLIPTFSWIDLSQWMRVNIQTNHGRVKSQDAIHGKYVFQIEKNENNNPSFFQIINLSAGPNKINNEVITLTLGGWIWGDKNDQIAPISLSDGKTFYSNKIKIDNQPALFAFPITFPASTKEVRVSLRVPKNSASTRIFMDGLFLVYGNHAPMTTQKVFLDDTNHVTIGDQILTNLIQNPSAEHGSLCINPTIEQKIQQYIPVHLSLTYMSIRELPKNMWYLELTTRNLVETFWGKFGWGHIPFSFTLIYPILGTVTFIGIIAGFLQVRNFVKPQQDVLVFFIVSTIIIWSNVYLRGLTSTITSIDKNYIPPARYAYPVVIPTILFMVLGWARISQLLRINTTNAKRLLHSIVIMAILILDIYAVYSILQYYTS